MRVFRTLSLAVLAVVASACTTIAPVASPLGSGGAAPSVVAGSLTPGATLSPISSVVPDASAVTSAAPLSPAPPVATGTPEPTSTPDPTSTPTTKPPKTAKPTRTPSPTPTPVAVDLSVFVVTADIPNPWYTDTDYKLPIHIALTPGTVPDAHVVVSIPEEGFSTNFDTGTLAAADSYSRDVTINVSAMGPATLTLQVKAPAGYTDYDKSNNKVQIAIVVQPKP